MTIGRSIWYCSVACCNNVTGDDYKMIRWYWCAVVALAVVLCPLSAQAAAVRAGQDPGFHFAILKDSGAIDYVAGPVTLGIAIQPTPVSFVNPVGGSIMEFSPVPSAHLIWELLKRQGLVVGLMAGYASTNEANPAFVAARGSGSIGPADVARLVNIPSNIPVYHADVGLTLSAFHDFTNFWGGTNRITFAPTMTVMLDGNQRMTQGPHSDWELGVQITPALEVLVLVASDLTKTSLAGVRGHF